MFSTARRGASDLGFICPSCISKLRQGLRPTTLVPVSQLSTSSTSTDDNLCASTASRPRYSSDFALLPRTQHRNYASKAKAKASLSPSMNELGNLLTALKESKATNGKMTGKKRRAHIARAQAADRQRKLIVGALTVVKSVLESQGTLSTALKEPKEKIRVKKAEAKKEKPPAPRNRGVEAQKMAKNAESAKAKATKDAEQDTTEDTPEDAQQARSRNDEQDADTSAAQASDTKESRDMKTRKKSNEGKESSSFVVPSSEERGSPVNTDMLAAFMKQQKADEINDEAVDQEKGKNGVQRVAGHMLKLSPVPTKEALKVPNVQYGLDRVLFNPGVVVLQDSRSKVYNFDPYLSTIMPVDEFDFNALKQYITSSKDTRTIKMAKDLGKSFTGSTSSMTTMLSHFHYLLSAWRPINPANTSRDFKPESMNFTRIMRAPAAAFLNYKDGVYAIDADKEYDSGTILSMLGKSMEKFLTLPKHKYERYRRSNSGQLSEEEKSADEQYHYSTYGDFLMRSQLDAHDPRLPGTGMYDLKTRAVVSIRMDAKDYERGRDYEIRTRIGQWESFEREYFDMIRAAFLKYSLQVRMGRMDGIFVAFHNTQRIFGFQYIPIEEMDHAIHGHPDRLLGDREFLLSLHLFNKVLEKAVKKYPGRSLRVHIESRPSDTPFMYIFAEPVTKGEIDEVQQTASEAIAKFEAEMLNIKTKPDEADPESLENADEYDLDGDATGADLAVALAEDEESSEDVWESMREAVEATMEREASGIDAIREAIEGALEQSGLLKTDTSDMETSEEAKQQVDALLRAITSEEAEGDEFDSVEDDQAVANAVAEATELGAVLDGEQSSSEDEQPATSEEEQTDDAADTASLQSLILKLTSRAGRSSISSVVEDETSDDMTSDQSRLREFERVLSDMVSKTDDRTSKVERNVETSDQRNDSPSSKLASDNGKDQPAADEGSGELLGMILTIRNKVNEKYVQRPEEMSRNDRWDVEYDIKEIPPGSAARLYKQIKGRRRNLFSNDYDSDNKWNRAYMQNLQTLSKKGATFRKKADDVASRKPVWVLGRGKSLNYAQVFKSPVRSTERRMRKRAVPRPGRKAASVPKAKAAASTGRRKASARATNVKQTKSQQIAAAIKDAMAEPE